MLGFGRGSLIEGSIADYVIFDLETTGIHPKDDRIIEISAIKVKERKIVEEFSTLVNPGIPIPPAASIVNKIKNDMVKDAPFIETAIKDFTDFIEDDILIGHNIHEFDMKFIHRDIERHLGMFLRNDYIDTLPMSRLLLPNLPKHRLVDLANHYGISDEGAHRALNDCRMTRSVYEKLCQAYEKAK